jgi:hypothetical protein
MLSFKDYLDEGKRGLWDNIHAKRNRIKNGSGEHMRKPGSKGAPTAAALKAAAESFEQNFEVLEEAAKAIDQGEYDYEGQMARTQLQTIYRNSKDLIAMLSDEENMPEWVQSKITLAQDYITCVRDYLQSKEELEEDAKGYKNPTGGLTQKGRDHYNNKYGSHLKAPVTTPPSELKPGSKAANRRKSFCARMSGVEGPMKKPNGEPTRKALALRKWNC